MKLTERLTAQISYDIRSRGSSYYLSGRVRLVSCHPTEVYSTVRGSRLYDVDLELLNGTIKAFCTCPYAELCKHIWATILAAGPKGFAQAAAELQPLTLEHDDLESDDDPTQRRPSAPVRPAPSPKRENWKDQLDALSRDVAPAINGSHRTEVPNGDRQLVLVVDLQASELARKLVVDINTRERKTNGEWGKPQAKYVTSGYIGQLADPLDRKIAALLAGGERHESYSYSYGSSQGLSRYGLAGPLLDALLPLLAQSGRVALRRPGRPPPPLEELVDDLDPPWVLKIGVTPGETAKQWILSGYLHRGDESMPLAAPMLIVPGLVIWNGRFGRFDDSGGYSWVTSLRKIGRIVVPTAGVDDLIAQLLRLPQLPSLVLPEELRFTEVAVAPTPRLVVKPPKQANPYGTSMLQAELSFEYDGVEIPALPFTRGFLKAEGRCFVLRDPAAEQAADRELDRLGVRLAWTRGEQKLELKPSLLPKLVRELVPAGWKVEADGKLYRQAGELKFKVRSELDWFDLDGSADFGGRLVPFPRLLEALRRGDSSIPLDDGTFGMVPEEWLKKYGLLAQMGKVQGDSIRFSKAQVGVLDALLASRPEVTFDKQFAKARDQLRKFTGVAAVDPPKGFRGELREYQREGLGWLRFIRKFGFGGCLADDMGLGKTVQVLALLAGKRTGPALVVVPKSLIFNWKSEAAKFAPKLKVLDHTGSLRDRTGANFKDFDIVLTTYGTLRKDAETFAEFKFDTCVLDESQAAKNAATETAKAVRVVQADHRIAMSGTPVENHLGELWTLFDFLNPGMLGRGMVTGTLAGSIRNPDQETREMLAKALRPYILRRTKDQVAKDLPAKSEQTVFCDLEPAQRRLYDELLAHYRQSLLARVDSVGLAKSKIHVLEALLRLRQAACHPGLIDKARRGETSAKLDVLLPQLRELAESGCKALVFSQFTSLLAIVRDRLDADGVKYEYLDGKTNDRAARVEKFQSDPTCKLFLISLKAGGVGLNLTSAEYVFLLDPWWNPAVEAQAIDRTHRIGQTKPVFAYRLIARGTVEEKVLALQQSKRELADAILGGDGRLITDLKREDLELLLS